MGNQTASAEYTIASAGNANATGQKLSDKMQEFFANVCTALAPPPPPGVIRAIFRGRVVGACTGYFMKNYTEG
jgi:hypothetical protein